MGLVAGIVDQFAEQDLKAVRGDIPLCGLDEASRVAQRRVPGSDEWRDRLSIVSRWLARYWQGLTLTSPPLCHVLGRSSKPGPSLEGASLSALLLSDASRLG